jgi:hypothetical protein
MSSSCPKSSVFLIVVFLLINYLDGCRCTSTYSFGVVATSTFMQACNDTTTAYAAAEMAFGNIVSIICYQMENPDQQIGLLRAKSLAELMAVNSELNGARITAEMISSITLFFLRTPLTLVEEETYKETFESFPLIVNGALIGHNIQEVLDSNTSLKLSQALLVAIFSGQLQSWYDARVLDANPFLKTNAFQAKCSSNPGCPVSIGFRKDRFLSTLILTRALYSMSPSTFANAFGPEGLQSGTDLQTQLTTHFPFLKNAGLIFLSPNAGLGLYAWMTATPYSVIIAPQEDVEKFGFQTALIENKQKMFTTCSEASVNS